MRAQVVPRVERAHLKAGHFWRQRWYRGASLSASGSTSCPGADCVEQFLRYECSTSIIVFAAVSLAAARVPFGICTPVSLSDSSWSAME